MYEFEILNTLTEDSTVDRLKSNTKSYVSPKRDVDSNRVQISNIQFVPLVNNNALTVKCKSRTGDKGYVTSVNFQDVEFVEPNTPNSASFQSADRTTYDILRLSTGRNIAKVNCNCLDFYYTFSVWNSKDNSLDGDPPVPYVKKTDRLPRNPKKKPGMCKHLIKFITILKSKNIVQ
jgi:hypothetical protein